MEKINRILLNSDYPLPVEIIRDSKTPYQIGIKGFLHSGTLTRLFYECLDNNLKMFHLSNGTLIIRKELSGY